MGNFSLAARESITVAQNDAKFAASAFANLNFTKLPTKLSIAADFSLAILNSGRNKRAGAPPVKFSLELTSAIHD
jgi:hypothetical protein